MPPATVGLPPPPSHPRSDLADVVMVWMKAGPLEVNAAFAWHDTKQHHIVHAPLPRSASDAGPRNRQPRSRLRPGRNCTAGEGSHPAVPLPARTRVSHGRPPVRSRAVQRSDGAGRNLSCVLGGSSRDPVRRGPCSAHMCSSAARLSSRGSGQQPPWVGQHISSAALDDLHPCGVYTRACLSS